MEVVVNLDILGMKINNVQLYAFMYLFGIKKAM
jgi:hypothetical protein